MKKSLFIPAVLLLVIMTTTTLTYSADIFTAKIKTFYQEKQKEQKAAMLGNFTSPREKEAFDWSTFDFNLIESTFNKKENHEKPKLNELTSNSAKSSKQLNILAVLFFLAYILLFLLFSIIFLRLKFKREKAVLKDAMPSKIPPNNSPQSSEEADFESTCFNLHIIRRMVRDWQSNLSEHEKKRPQETMQEWFRRIDGPEDIIPIYEKVRYGMLDFTDQEYRLLIKSLK